MTVLFLAAALHALCPPGAVCMEPPPAVALESGFGITCDEAASVIYEAHLNLLAEENVFLTRKLRVAELQSERHRRTWIAVTVVLASVAIAFGSWATAEAVQDRRNK